MPAGLQRWPIQSKRPGNFGWLSDSCRACPTPPTMFPRPAGSRRFRLSGRLHVSPSVSEVICQSESSENREYCTTMRLWFASMTAVGHHPPVAITTEWALKDFPPSVLRFITMSVYG